MEEKIIPTYLPKCTACIAYKKRTADPKTNCSIPPDRRSLCPCFDCIIIVMCEKCCDTFKDLRDKFHD